MASHDATKAPLLNTYPTVPSWCHSDALGISQLSTVLYYDAHQKLLGVASRRLAILAPILARDRSSLLKSRRLPVLCFANAFAANIDP